MDAAHLEPLSIRRSAGLPPLLDRRLTAGCLLDPSRGIARAFIDFEAGTFELALPNMSFSFLDSDGFRFFNQQYEHSVYGMEFGALRSAFEYLVGCLRNGTRPEISTIEDGYHAVRVIEAALESARSDRWSEGD